MSASSLVTELPWLFDEAGQGNPAAVATLSRVGGVWTLRVVDKDHGATLAQFSSRSISDLVWSVRRSKAGARA